MEKPNSACLEGNDAALAAAGSSLENVTMRSSMLVVATCLLLAGCGNTLEQRISGAAVGGFRHRHAGLA